MCVNVCFLYVWAIFPQKKIMLRMSSLMRKKLTCNFHKDKIEEKQYKFCLCKSSLQIDLFYTILQINSTISRSIPFILWLCQYIWTKLWYQIKVHLGSKSSTRIDFYFNCSLFNLSFYVIFILLFCGLFILCSNAHRLILLLLCFTSYRKINLKIKE